MRKFGVKKIENLEGNFVHVFEIARQQMESLCRSADRDRCYRSPTAGIWRAVHDPENVSNGQERPNAGQGHDEEPQDPKCSLHASN